MGRYSTVILLSLVTLILYLICNVVLLLFFMDVASTLSINIWKWYALGGIIAWPLAKQAMYLIFLFRLHGTYRDTSYEYNSRVLVTIGTLSCVWTLIVCVNTVLFSEVQTSVAEDLPFPVRRHCNVPFWAILMSTASDITLSVVFIFLFVKPLRKMTKQMGHEQMKQLHYVGVKALILTSICIVTTLIFLLYLLLTHKTIFLALDSSINCICILMMTPYYPDNLFYKKLCILFIKCNKKYNSKKVQTLKIMHVANNTPTISDGTSIEF